MLICCLNIGKAQSGQLDPAFGNQGVVSSDLGAHYNYPNEARQVLCQPDGSIYIVCSSPVCITKRLPNGSIDSGYGVNGYSKAVTCFDGYAAFQPDGKIIIVGTHYKSPGIMERLKVNGMPDSSFGKNGIQTISIPPVAVSIKKDGKIVVVGSAIPSSVAQYNTNGSLDTTFNGCGYAPFDFLVKIRPIKGSVDSVGIQPGNTHTVAIQPDGKIIVGGAVYSSLTGYNIAIARYNLNGSYDSSFDGDGKQTTFVGSGSRGFSLVVQNDGKIILAGETSNGSNNCFAVVRYNLNGSLDPSFNGTGIQTANLYSDFQIRNSMALQSTGKILLGGYMLNGAYHDFALARLNDDGKMDSTFDKDGILTTDFNSSDDYTGSVIVQSDDKIMLAGYASINPPTNSIIVYAVSRYTPEGELDNSFAVNGKLMGDYHQGNTGFNATVIQPDGKILVAGHTWNGNNDDFVVARFNSDGSVDKNFGDNGRQITDFGALEEAKSILLQGDGKIVLCGNKRDGNNPYNIYQFAAARYNSNGTLDKSFGVDGVSLISPFGRADICNTATLQKDGKIVMAGASYLDIYYDSAQFAVIRLKTNGKLDVSFGEQGIKLTGLNTAFSTATSISIQSDEKIVAGGRVFLNMHDYFAITRYNTDGSLDTSFSHDGKLNRVFGQEDYFLESLVIQTDGKIVAAGFSEGNGGGTTSFEVARFTTSGELDLSFNKVGYQSTWVGPSYNFGMAVAVNYDGRIVVGGTNDKFAMVMYKNDGSLDSSFGINGIQITFIGVFESRIQSVAFDMNRIYAVGYGQYPGTIGVIARYQFYEGGALPVSLLNFNAVLQNDYSVLLLWQTTNEQNIAGFNIQRSADATNFSSIGYVAAKGNSNIKLNYHTIDQQPLQEFNYYRLKMMQEDGSFTYSNIVSIIIRQHPYSLRVFPNPATGNLFVQVESENEKTTFQIIDAGGRKMKEGSIYLIRNSSLAVDVFSLPKGIYYFRLVTESKIETRRFLKE